MSTYSISGTGTHALTAGTTGLQLTITTPSSIGGLGRSNPAARYDQGLIRFSDGTAYWAPVAILGGPSFVPVPQNASSFGFALLGGAVVSVVEVINGTVFFSGGVSSLAALSDVTLSGLADGQLIQWNAADSRWKNVTPASPVAGLVLLTDTVLSSDDSSIGTGTIPGGSRSLWALWKLRTDQTSQTVVLCSANGDTTNAHYSNSTSGTPRRMSVVEYSSHGTNLFTQGQFVLPDYATVQGYHNLNSMVTRPDGGNEGDWWCWFPSGGNAAITSLSITPAAGNFKADSRLTTYGLP